MDEFKFNSQVCTSKIQSERLLKLGLKRETADMSHTAIIVNHKVQYIEHCSTPKGIDLPAWSLHRLIELIDEPEHIARWIGVQIANDYDYTVGCIEWLIKEGYFNKEYLNGTAED